MTYLLDIIIAGMVGALIGGLGALFILRQGSKWSPRSAPDGVDRDLQVLLHETATRIDRMHIEILHLRRMSGVAHIRADKNGIIRGVSANTDVVLGHPPESLVGKHIHVILARDMRGHHHRVYTRANEVETYEREVPVVGDAMRADGTVFRVVVLVERVRVHSEMFYVATIAPVRTGFAMSPDEIVGDIPVDLVGRRSTDQLPPHGGGSGDPA